MANVLIINAHHYYEGWSTGRLNAYLAEIIQEEMQKKGYQVQSTRIDQGYDVAEEVEKHLWADVIILQTPVNWFGAPWIHKKYLDEVFNAGLQQQSLIVDDGRSRTDPHRQYGMGGKMQGKRFMMSLTWNAPAEAFGDKDQYLYEGKTADDAFLHISTCYKFCGADSVPAFSSFNVMKAPDIDGDVIRLRKHLALYFGDASADADTSGLN